MEKGTKLTSVKIEANLFEVFKLECVKRKFSLNKLVNRAVYLYLNDEDFRRQLHNNKVINK